MFRNILYNPVSHLLLIILLGLLAYSNTFNVPFQWDDLGNIIENSRIKSVSNIPSFFTYIEGQPIMARPLTAATFAINYYFGRLNTTGYHIFNLALHIANGILLFFLIKITAGYLNYKDEKTTGLIALFSSLIFVVHPLQTESVTYIVTRSALLSTFFFLLGIILFTKAARLSGKKKTAWIVALFITSLMGMASREEFFIFPIMLILYDLYFVSEQNVRGVLKNYKIHLPVILTLAYVIFIVASYDYGKHAGYGVKAVTPLQYLMTQFNTHWTYLRLLVFPINQNLDYDYPIAKTLLEFPTIISFVGYIGLWVTGIYLYKKRPVISFCILWFMLTLSPSSSIMPILDMIFEHRLYMPLISLIVMLPMSMFYAINRFSHLKNILILFPIISIVVLSYTAYQRNTVWKDEIKLWGDVVKKSPQKARGHNNLGLAYDKTNLKNKAVAEYNEAIRLKHDYADAYNNLGSVYDDLGLIDKAIPEYLNALRLRPEYLAAHYNLGTAYGKKGLLDMAIQEFQTTLRLKPDHSNAHFNLGYAYYKKGMLNEAIEEFKIALRLNPDYATALSNLRLDLKKKTNGEVILQLTSPFVT